jgi:hypothetical protein
MFYLLFDIAFLFPSNKTLFHHVCSNGTGKPQSEHCPRPSVTTKQRSEAPYYWGLKLLVHTLSVPSAIAANITETEKQNPRIQYVFIKQASLAVSVGCLQISSCTPPCRISFLLCNTVRCYCQAHAFWNGCTDSLLFASAFVFDFPFPGNTWYFFRDFHRLFRRQIHPPFFLITQISLLINNHREKELARFL